MRRFFRWSALVALVCVAAARGAEPAKNPEFRPAVLVSGRESLINRIDANALAAAGQKDGAVMFCVVVDKTGVVKQSRTYRAMPGSMSLEGELRKRLADTRFTPAIYNHQPVAVVAVGTVVFGVNGDKPAVRLFLNQDPVELQQGNDFIAPQPVFGADSAFTGLDYPEEISVQVNAVVDVGFAVDAKGNLKDMRLLGEEPPLLGFAAVAAKDFSGVKFIPAFRSGDAIASESVYSICYQPQDWKAPSFAVPPPQTAAGSLTP